MDSELESGGLERRLVAEPAAALLAAALEAAAAAETAALLGRGGRGGRPGVVGGGAAETAATLPGGAVDLGRGVTQGRADLVDLDLVDGALLAFLGLVGALLEPPLDDDPHPALEALGGVLGRLAPDVAREEEALDRKSV